MTTPVTQRDVAAACKVHPSTICLALNNSPSIPLATRQRIQLTAQKLGYRPNAAARNLAFMRAEKGPPASLPLAWINQEPQRDFWRANPAGRAHFEAARRRATELGYHLEEFGLHEAGMSTGRLAQIIHARGIQGVVFPCLHTYDEDLFQPAWAKFACISFNDHRAADWMDVVCPDYYHNADRVITELARRGFDRMGLVLTERFDQATHGRVTSRYLRHAAMQGRNNRMPVCLVGHERKQWLAEVERWYRQHRPDVVLCHDADLVATLEEFGQEVCLVQLGALSAGLQPGIDELPGEVAAAAIERLAEKIRRHEHGIGESTQCHLIKGRWTGGELAALESQAVA
ncbi:MAG: hypothetical protein R3F03_02395 [Opitutaceae bacterium]